MSMSAATEQIMFNEMMRVRKSMKHSPHESNYTRLFGTPERAARTLEKHCDGYHCIICPAHHHNCNDGDYDALLEWLKGEGE